MRSHDLNLLTRLVNKSTRNGNSLTYPLAWMAVITTHLVHFTSEAMRHLKRVYKKDIHTYHCTFDKNLKKETIISESSCRNPCRPSSENLRFGGCV